MNALRGKWNCIDFHRHPYKNVKVDLQNEDIDAAVLLPVGDLADSMARKLATEFPDTFVPFCWLGYLNDMGITIDRLASAIKSGAKAIKFQPLLQHFFPDEKRMYPIYERCVEHDMVALFHTGMVAFREEFGIPLCFFPVKRQKILLNTHSVFQRQGNISSSCV